MTSESTQERAERPSEHLRVMVADDHPLMRGAVRSYIETTPDMTCVGEAEDGAAAVDLALQSRPDVVVMDVQMPKKDGIQATSEIMRRAPGTAVLTMTTFDQELYAVRSLQAGARGYLLKSARAEELLQAIRDIASGEVPLSAKVAEELVLETARDRASIRRALDRYSVPEVPERQLAVLTLLGRGYSNAEIAEELFLAEDTVKKYLQRLNDRFETRDRVQLLIRAVQLGYVNP